MECTYVQLTLATVAFQECTLLKQDCSYASASVKSQRGEYGISDKNLSINVKILRANEEISQLRSTQHYEFILVCAKTHM